MNNKIKILILILVICFIIGMTLWISVKGKNFIMDEDEGHGANINYYVTGEYDKVIEKLTMPPTYHIIIGSISKMFKINTPGGYRLINFLILLFCLIPVFYISCNFNVLRTLQFFFFPIMFMFYFLLYTDLFSLFLILLSFLLLTKNSYYLSSLSSLFAIFVRQDNLIWALFFCSYIYFKEQRATSKEQRVKKYFKKIIGYLISILILLIYILYRGKLVLGDNIQHPIGVHFGNVWFSLFVFFLMFFPIILSHIKYIKNYVMNRKKPYLLILIIAFLFCFISFTNKHFYNHERGFWFNEVLLSTDNIFFRIFFVIAICVSLSYFLTLKYKDTEKYLLYPFSIIFLSLSLLIDPRYYFIPFTFFLIFRKEENKKIEYILLFYYITICLFFFLRLITTNKF